MLSYKEINELIQALDASSLTELEFEVDGVRLKLCKNTGIVEPVYAVSAEQKREVHQPLSSSSPSSVPAVAIHSVGDGQPVKAESVAELKTIKSPMIGTFYCAPAPDKPNFVKVGDQVKARTVVCILEAMKLMNEIEAECEGEIVEILVENGQLVEYGQPMFLVRPL